MTLEQLGLGTAATGTLDQLDRRIRQLQRQIANLNAQSSVGNLNYGGPIKQEITQSSFLQSFIRDADADTPFEFDIIIPDNWLRIHRCMIWLTPRPLRKTIASASGAATGAGSSHDHGLSGSVGDPTNGSGNIDMAASGTGNTSSNNPDTPHNHTGPSHTHNLTYDIIHNHDVGSLDAAAEAAHTHPAGVITLTDGVTEGDVANDITITIDGVDRTTALGGNWDADANFDISQYLINSLFIPVFGRHPIIIAPDGNGAIEVTIEWHITSKPIL